MAKIKTTKKQLLNFISDMERRTCSAANKSWDIKVSKAKNGLLHSKGYYERIDKLQLATNALYHMASTLLLELNEDVEVRYKSYHTLATALSQHIGEHTIMESIMEESYFDGGLAEKLENQRDAELESIRQQYTNVKVNIESFISVRSAAEYLQNIGFDLSKFEMPETAVVANVDASKLFYKDVE